MVVFGVTTQSGTREQESFMTLKVPPLADMLPVMSNDQLAEQRRLQLRQAARGEKPAAAAVTS